MSEIRNWRKSNRSQQGQCVEVGWSDQVAGVRDTAEAHLPAELRPTITASHEAVSAFISAAMQ